MIKYLILFFPLLLHANQVPPSPVPIFLKLGFSSVLEFSDMPTRVVLGDSQSFQVEKFERSLVVRTMVSYATSNMFVYFKTEKSRLFILTASEEVEPTYISKFENVIPQKPPIKTFSPAVKAPLKTEAKLVSALFDVKKDYLSVDVEISADTKSLVKPKWEEVRIQFNKNEIKPFKLWSQRKDVQRDSRVRARFIFLKPDIPKDLKGVSLSVPQEGNEKAFSVALVLNGGKR